MMLRAMRMMALMGGIDGRTWVAYAMQYLFYMFWAETCIFD
jgi:hypothetical protein